MKHMMKTLIPAVIAAGFALPLVVTPLVADDAADEAAIRELWTSYQTLVVAGEGEAWVGLWDPDGIQLPPGAPMRGYDALVAEAPTWTPDDVDAMSIMPMEIVILGDTAYSMGTYTLEFATDAGPGQVDGKFMTILHRQDDGSWRIFRDIYNSNVE